MKKIIQTYWKDPVFSKIIAKSILGLFGLLFVTVMSQRENFSATLSMLKSNNFTTPPALIILSVGFNLLLIALFFNEKKKNYSLSNPEDLTDKNLAFYNRLIASRLSIAISYDVNLRFPDNTHEYSHMKRHDFITEEKYISLRSYKLKNVTTDMSNFIIHTESVENKMHPEEIHIKAFNNSNDNELKVEKLQTTEKSLFHDFKIYFDEALPPNGVIDVRYLIILNKEVSQFEFESEVNGICLNRYKKGVNELHFKISLLLRPKTYFVESMDQYGNKKILPSELKLEEHSMSEYEKNIISKYSKTETFQTISLCSFNVKEELLIINFKL
ncbi:MAG: hypothetical protein WC856_21530 [Methylococcaceae bacterium]|jgi:hypothetical protein